MRSQKVPGMMVLHTNGRAYSNIHFQSRTFKHTYLLYQFHCYWIHRWKTSFGIFRCSAVAFHLLSPMVAKCVHLRPIFRAGNSQQSLGARSGEHGGWVMTVIAAQQAMWGSVRYLDGETTVPACHLLRRYLRTASRNLCKACTYKWPATLCPGGTNLRCIK
jgi:hypothetical protein